MSLLKKSLRFSVENPENKTEKDKERFERIKYLLSDWEMESAHVDIEKVLEIAREDDGPTDILVEDVTNLVEKIQQNAQPGISELDQFELIDLLGALLALYFTNRFKNTIEKQEKIQTKDLNAISKNITTSTWNNHIGKRFEKLDQSIRIREYLDNSDIKNLPLIYFGAGEDIEYPIAMGARKIKMVDAGYKENLDLAGFIKEAEEYFNMFEAQVEGNKLIMKVDFGKGKEEVEFEFIDKPAHDYEPPNEIAGFITYAVNNPSFKIKDEVIKNIVKGGIVSSNDLDENINLTGFKEDDEEDNNTKFFIKQ